jgi:hypothetical protein
MKNGLKTFQQDQPPRSRTFSRKDFLKQLCLATGFLLASCSPLRIAFNIYPARFKDDPELCDGVLRSFVTTVIPGASQDEPDLTRMFYDEYYPFYEYTGFFASDLCQRATDLYGMERFDQLTLVQRTKVIEEGLRADSTVRRLYRGAILMAQVSFFAGIYDAEKGCPLIDFHGANTGFFPEEMYYADCRSMLAPELTADGNYF